MLEKQSDKNPSYSRFFKKEDSGGFELFNQNLVQSGEDLKNFKFFSPLVKKLNLAQQGLKAFFRSRTRLSLYRRIITYQEFGFLDKNMLPVCQKRMRGRINREIILTWNPNLTLSENLKPWIPEAEYLILKSAQDAGHLEEGLNEIEKLLDYQKKIKDSIMECCGVPLCILIGVYSLAFVFSHNMAPVYMSMIPLAKWAPENRLLYYVSHYFTLFFPFVLAGTGLYAWWKNKKTHWYSLLLKKKTTPITERIPNPDPYFDNIEIMEQGIEAQTKFHDFKFRMKAIVAFSSFLLIILTGLIYVNATSLNNMVVQNVTQSAQNQ